MSWGAYGILIIFGLFVLLMIINPSLSCFGKRVKSPFSPLLRRKPRKIKTENYNFHLVNKNSGAKGEQAVNKKAEQAEDYGFRLDE